MSLRTRSVAYLSTVLALTASACSSSLPTASSSSSAAPLVECLGATLRSAAELAAYASCDVVRGDLRLQQSDVGDLSALRRLRSVSGTLEIAGNAQLEDLGGLECLTGVEALEIKGNPALSDLEALNSLRSARFVTISYNPALRSLRGLDGLERAEGMKVEHNGIRHTAGLSGLREVGSLVVSDNAKLISLAGLRGLKRAKSVEISKNPLLSGYFGLLPQLTRVEHKLMLHANKGLAQRDLRRLMDQLDQAPARPLSLAATF